MFEAVRGECAALLSEQLGVGESDAKKVSDRLENARVFRVWSSLRFLRSDPSALVSFFFLEAHAAGASGRKCEAVKEYLVRNLTPSSKLALVDAYAFSAPYLLGESYENTWHVMQCDCARDSAWMDRNCGPYDWSLGCFPGPNQSCPCTHWLRDNPKRVDRYLGSVVDELCNMRHSLVHASYPTLLVSDAGTGHSGTLVDCYPCDRSDERRLKSYTVGLSAEGFRAIIAEAVGRQLVRDVA